MATELKHIPLKDIRENPVALRSVNRTTEGYLELVDSIRKRGVLNAISVREVKDPQTGLIVYGLVDGLHRFTASGDAGLDTIPAQVTNLVEADVLLAQILANVHKVETRPVEYSKQLLRILAAQPLMTVTELANTLSKSVQWLSERLGLVKLAPALAALVDDSKINLSNAYALAKLPPEEQPNFLDRSITMTPQEFVPTVTARVKELRDARRQGRDASSDEFIPVAHARKLGDLKQELEKGDAVRVLIREGGITDPVEAFKLGLKFAIHMDPQSIAAAKARDDQRKADAAKSKKEREEERIKKKEADAKAKANELQAALETANA